LRQSSCWARWECLGAFYLSISFLGAIEIVTVDPARVGSAFVSIYSRLQVYRYYQYPRRDTALPCPYLY
ncbi:hypothetical protein, partial [Microcoleus sp. herbarium5]|uniref:hypothetical protein n=1 Tax=Microcoleus sp. herbarium5 TaxID=3055434 RepID=UPI002FCEA166